MSTHRAVPPHDLAAEEAILSRELAAGPSVAASIATTSRIDATTALEMHAAAGFFPLMAGNEFDALVESIRAHGLRNPIVLAEGMILDGRNRYNACLAADVEPRFVEWEPRNGESPYDFVWSQNAERRHLDAGQKAALRLKCLEASEAWHKQKAAARARQSPGRPKKNGGNIAIDSVAKAPKARESLAAAAGVSPRTAQAALTLKQEAPEKFEAVADGKVSLNLAVKQAKQAAKKAALEVAARAYEPRRDCVVKHASMVDLLGSLSKVDAIITDPPYGEKYVELYAELAKATVSALGPEGILAVMTGQHALPGVLVAMTAHIPYRWVMAYCTPGGQAVQAWDKKVNTFWKPVLLFGAARDWLGDVVSSAANDNDKRFHEWGQSESGMARLVERLTKPGDLVCDPFLGAGTTAVVCVQLKRKFVGGDIDAEAVTSAKGRLQALAKVKP